MYGFAGGDPVNFSDPFGLEPLTKEEREALGDFCKLIDCDRVNVYRGNDDEETNHRREQYIGQMRGHSFTTMYDIYLNDADADRDDRLAHEMTHVVQMVYYGQYAYNQLFKEHLLGVLPFIGRDPYRWRDKVRPGKGFDKFRFEQQAQIVEDCFGGDALACSISWVQPGGGR